jgi:hypothetical protein
MVLYTHADLADKTGKKLELDSGVYNHHMIGTDYGRKMIAPPIVNRCPNGMMGGFNFGAGSIGMGKKGGGSNGASGATGGHGGHGAMKKRQAPDLSKLLGMPYYSKSGF